MASKVPIGNELLGGAIIINVFAALSAFALVTIILRMVVLFLNHRLSQGRAVPTECAFLLTNFGCYAACLLLATIFTAWAGLISVRWTVMRAVSDDNVCKLQVAITQVGNWSTAYFTVAIALHTFNSLVLRVRQSAIICNVTMAVGWATAFVAGVVPVVIHPGQYGPSLVTCDFLPAFGKAKFLLHVLPILVSSVLSAGMYSTTFLVLRGTLSFKDGIRLTVDPTERRSMIGTDPCYHRLSVRIAGAMLWFPIAYIVLLVPYSILQLLVISGFNVSFGALVFSSVLWFDLGIVNVLLMYNVFRVLEPVIDSSVMSKRTEESLLPIYRESKNLESPRNDDSHARSRTSNSFEYGLPNEYSELIRPSATNPRHPTIPRPKPTQQRPEEPMSPLAQLLVAGDKMAAEGWRDPAVPVRPPRPATVDMTLKATSPVGDQIDQPPRPKDTLQMLGQARKWEARLRGHRPALSAPDSKASRSRIILDGGGDPNGNYI